MAKNRPATNIQELVFASRRRQFMREDQEHRVLSVVASVVFSGFLAASALKAWACYASGDPAFARMLLLSALLSPAVFLFISTMLGWLGITKVIYDERKTPVGAHDLEIVKKYIEAQMGPAWEQRRAVLSGQTKEAEDKTRGLLESAKHLRSVAERQPSKRLADQIQRTEALAQDASLEAKAAQERLDAFMRQTTGSVMDSIERALAIEENRQLVATAGPTPLDLPDFRKMRVQLDLDAAATVGDNSAEDLARLDDDILEIVEAELDEPSART